MKKIFLFLFSFILLLSAEYKVILAAPPTNFQTTPIITSGLTAPTSFEFAPDGRIFILQRTGEIYIYKNGQLLSQPFAVLPSSNTGDRGLIGVVFDPNFLTNHWVYFYYNSSADLLNYLVRFDASTDVGQNGPVILYHTTIQSQMLHEGGGIGFGPDGKLYIGIGDNGYPPNAQDLTLPFGKIIRINKDGTIPSDNPFFSVAGDAKEIWAYGFRNPWKLQFDSSTGRLYVGDAGEASWEEINLVTKGANYGWPIAEGYCTANCTGLTDPIYAYPHNGASSAVTGGPVYRGSMFPSPYSGSYFFGDYAQGFIDYMILNTNGGSSGVTTFDPSAGSVVDIKVAPDGSLYYLDIFPGVLFQTIYTTGNKVPVVKASANVTQGNNPLTVIFSSAGTSDTDGDSLTYLWDFGDGTTSTSPNPSKTYSNKGRFTVTLKVSDGTYTVPSYPIVIQVGTPPTVTINSPINGAIYQAGNIISYSASAVDGSGASMPDSAFTTNVVFHHLTHIHPFLGPLTGVRQGSFAVPVTGEVSADTYFEIDITATDSFGLSTTSVVNVYPLKVNLGLASSPTGLPILLDGQSFSTGQTIVGVAGFQREVRPVSWQQQNGIYYQLDHWWDNGPAAHFIVTPSTDTTITGYYAAMPGFSAQYFNNTTLSGTPVITRNDPIINFNWGSTSPGSPLTLNNYSVRWDMSTQFVAGRYVFTTTTDDGARLYIDGQLVIDQWHDQPTTSYSYTADLTTGMHDIKMEYYQAYGGAVAQLTWDLTPFQPLSSPIPTPYPSVSPTPSPTPVPTTTPAPSGELLTSPWTLSTVSGGSAEQFQSIPSNALQGMTTLTITYNLNGNCLLTGDASAIVFDQPSGTWHYISLANYGQNCLNGSQTVSIPLSQFAGLNTTQPVGNFHARFWNSTAYSINISSAKLSAGAPTPTPAPTSTPASGTQLLTSPMHLTSASGGSVEAYQSIPVNVLSGNNTLTLTYNLNGFCALSGDASAIIFDQPSGTWHYVSLSNYGQNCLNGSQTVNIPLSDFIGLNLSQSVANFHVRFWSSGAYTVDITSAIVSSSQNPTPGPTSTPAPTTTPVSTTTPVPGTQLLTSPWNISSASGGAVDVYQSVPSNVLQNKTTLTLTYNLNGFCAVTGDASAIIFDQPIGGAWHYISLANYGQNCLNGSQTVSIPLSQFAGLNTTQPVGNFHARFWSGGSFTVNISSAIVN